jgi:hypothetical protein
MDAQHDLSLTKKLEITLNQIIESEFESFIGTSKYTHSNNRNITNNGKKIYRNGYRTRKLNTTLGTITLKIPRTNNVSFMPSFIERYKRNTDELNHLIQQMYINGISTGKVNKCIKALGVNSISKSQVSRITNKLKQEVESFNTRDLSDKQYDAIYIPLINSEKLTDNKGTINNIAGVEGVCEFWKITTGINFNKNNFILTPGENDIVIKNSCFLSLMNIDIADEFNISTVFCSFINFT